MEKSEQERIEDIDAVNLLTKNVVEFGRFSFELEERREQSLITQSGHMLTALSIFSATLLMALPLLIEHAPAIKIELLYSAGVVLIPIIASMILCVLSQWRFGYQTMINANAFKVEIKKDIKNHTTQSHYDYQWISQLSVIQDRKKKNNDTRVSLIKSAIICLLLSVILLFVTSLLLIIRNL